MNVKLMSLLLISGFVFGCATEEKKEEAEKTAAAAGPSIEAKQVAAEEEASYVTEFAFKKGSAKLSDGMKKNILQVMNQAKKSGEIKEFKVITWGDSEYPSTHTEKLSQAEVELVKKRNTAIRKYIEGASKGVDVETYSMAERPNALQNMLNTSDARVKKSLEVAGVPTTDTAVKTPSKASKAIVMAITE
ncbi:hypothetical protein AZI85_08745 [Bdellovibrio bacteriovorus]|uniref:Uncharacterized protein n=1 Tax=Bdellovibrio bacteriovorus TaxID=959 RepID=A0A150WE16_BDEBC|nr:hypothetical protein [Bdellovibrio bacteriovorus]KYG61038.1 hypothetical protein AZI85_08745 [Bdellovibrio bacteriovorus]